MRSGLEINNMKVIVRPFRTVKAPDKVTHVSTCPFCRKRNRYAVQRKEYGFWGYDTNFPKCPHYLHSKVKRIGRSYRRVAIYTNPSITSLTDGEKERLCEML